MFLQRTIENWCLCNHLRKKLEMLFRCSQPPVEQTWTADTTSLVPQSAVALTVTEGVSEASNDVETPKKVPWKESKLRWAKHGWRAERRAAKAEERIGQEAMQKILSGRDEKKAINSTRKKKKKA